jgi:hypothetical protein
MVCGVKLDNDGKLNALRAEVWEHGFAARRMMFYELEGSTRRPATL